MSAHASDKVFTGSIPQIYEQYLVPLIFEPYAADLARRLASRKVSDVLEVALALAAMFPQNPPRFLARTPYGYFDRAAIANDLRAAGFVANPEIVALPARSRAPSARDPAFGLCQGSPLRGEIEALDAKRL